MQSSSAWRISFKIVLTYAIFAMCWILLSDQAVSLLTSDSDTISWIQTLKGSGFVILTSLLLWTLLFRHLAQREKAEARLAESETLFRVAIRQAPYPILIHSEDGKIHQISAGLEKLSGYSLADLPDIDTWVDKAYGPDQTRVKSDISRLYNLTDTRSEGVYQITTTKGEQRFWEFSSAPLGSDTRGQRLVISMAADITEQLQAKSEALRRAGELEISSAQNAAKLELVDQELATISSAVAHDLRSPLRAMNGFASILIESWGTELPAQARQYLDYIRSSCNQLERMIDELVSFSRLSSQELTHSPVDLEQLVRQVYASVQARYPDEIAAIKIDPIAPCLGDRSMLTHIFTQLLDNSFKFTRGRAQREIRVGCQTRGAETVYFVGDNGIGFDRRFAQQLFGPFRRLNLAERFEGTGMGLAISRRMVERHGGRIWAEGKPGEGACFYFTLDQTSPLQQEASA